MIMHNTNGNGSATAPRRVLSGRGLAHRHLNKRQRACLAADVVDGLVTIQLTARQVSQLFGVSVGYIALAQQFTPEKRAAIMSGRDSTSFVALLNPPAPRLALPAPSLKVVNWDKANDDALLANVRAAGINRTWTAIEKLIG
jgi:hypothetical protein